MFTSVARFTLQQAVYHSTEVDAQGAGVPAQASADDERPQGTRVPEDSVFNVDNSANAVDENGVEIGGLDYPYTEEQLSYIPLHLHSDYSIMDGLESVGALVKQATKFKIPALALTDWTNVCGYIKFYSNCLSAGIKPIMGADLIVEEEVEPGVEPYTFNVTILAMDRIGKQNLYDILSESWLRSPGGVYETHTKLEELARFNEGLILLNGFRGDIATFAAEHNMKKVQERLDFYLKHYKDRFCFEITRTGREGETAFENLALDLCAQHGIAPVATNDTRFLYGDQDVGKDGLTDYMVHDVRVSVQNKCLYNNAKMAKMYSREQYMKSPEQMRQLFHDLPEAIVNTRMIAERCNVELELDVPRLPRYPTGDLTPADCLRQKSYEGLNERLEFLYPDPEEREKKRPEYEKRLEVELNVIITMDFPGYFLIVMEFIQWSKDHGVPVGPGRGSGGGSLVAYALKITDFDPMAFDLLFERFLNPERVSMPDFDVDFCQRNREKTLDHVKKTYGKNAVSQIAAFGTMAPKAAIKDVGRALGMTYGSVDTVAKMLPTAPGLTFKAAMGFDKKGNPMESVAPDFLECYNNAVNNDDKARIDLIHYAMRLEGVIKQIGKHAAGVVISPTRTAEFSPLMLDSFGQPITQFDKKDVEHAGLVKFDFLGLTTLTIIQDALDMINARKKRLGEPLVDVASIPYHDDESFEVLQQGETTAVFQLESDGMRRLISQMRPDRFDDMIALVALYRPGPIQSGMVDHFVKRKHGEEEVSYPSPDFQDLDLKPILESTYGVIVYQEQVMQLAQVLAGYSLGGADILRRAMGKKNPAEMESQRDVFRKGAAKNGKDTDIAMKIFDQVQKFAEYGFNKSHSAAYALVAWWTLYLKVHYPAEFLAAMMTADRTNTVKLVSYIAECKRLNIPVNPPSVNVGRFDFTVDEDGSVIYGLGAINGIGEELVNQIVADRNENGPFKDYFDFVARIGTQRLNKKSLESFIFSGALDCFAGTRAQKFASIVRATTYANQKKADQETGQTDLFAMMDDIDDTPEFETCHEWPEKYTLTQEKAKLGLYVSGHPINGYIDELRSYCSTALGNVRPGSSDRPSVDTVCGVVISLESRLSKRDNQKFYILTLDDATSQLTLQVYGKQAESLTAILEARANSHDQRLSSMPADTDDSLRCDAPLILIMKITCYSSPDGVRYRVRHVETMDLIRRKSARNITLCFEKKFYEENHEFINSTLMRNALPISEIKAALARAGVPPRTQLPGMPPPPAHPPMMQSNNRRGGRYDDGDNEIFVEEGCSLSIMLDDVRINLKNDTMRFIPSDDLIESIRDLAGADAVHIGYTA